MNPALLRNIAKCAGAMLTAILGAVGGKKYSDVKHKPIYARQREAAQDLNNMHKKKKMS